MGPGCAVPRRGVCAVTAHIGVTILSGGDLAVPMVGASGAVAAVMGLFMLRFHQTQVVIFYRLTWYFRGTFWIQSVWALGI